MRLPAVPVTSLEDATLDFEALQAVLTAPGSQLPFLQLASAKQLQIATGTGNATFTASTFSASVAVTHNLGRVPVYAAATNSANNGVWFAIVSSTTSQVTFGGWFFSATTGTFPFVWVAIG